MLSKCISNNIAKENYLCNIGPEHTDMFLYENNLRNVHLICLGQQCTKWLPAQCRQCSPTVHCLVNVFQIRMRQNCTRKLLVQYSPRVHRYTFTGKPTASNISGGLFCNQVHHHRAIFVQSLFTTCGTTMNSDRHWVEHVDFCSTRNIWETRNFGMFFLHTFPVLWEFTLPMFWESSGFLLHPNP